MDEPTVLYSELGRVALISHNRPREMNASSRELRADLREAMDAAESNDDIRVVVYTGEGRAFGAGADLKDRAVKAEHATVTDHILLDHKPLIDSIRSSQKTYIAAVNGATAGVSIAYALACDLIMMAESAYLYSPFASIGLVPDGGVCWFLLRRLGRQRAHQMIVESDRLTAAECLSLGVANKVVQDGELREAALAWAHSLATERAPLALRYAKEVLTFAEDASFDEVVRKEAELQQNCVTSRDHKEAVKAFLEKRPAAFHGE